jgi:DNA-binding transcriptional regulator GbsR (MarR family)
MTTPAGPTHERFIEHFGLLWEGQGLSRIAGRIVGLLTLQDSPLSLDDIAASLGVSKGSVSHDARRLQSLGLLQRVPAPGGDRRDFYIVAPDLPHALLAQRAKELEGLATALEAAVALPDMPSAVRTRLQQFGRFHRAVVANLHQIVNSISK